MGGIKVKTSRFFLYLLGGVFAILFLIGVTLSMMVGSDADPIDNAIGVIEVNGAIVSGESGNSLLGEVFAGSKTLMRQIRTAAEDDSIEALILRINSPGGSVPPTEAIYKEILRFKEETNKPVLAVMGGTAASGGYFLSAAADEIYANPATITGSIGVIMQFRNYEELYDKYGIKVNTIKSGKYKDIGNPARELTDEERQLLQKLVDQMYQRFVDAVVQGRELKRDKVLELAQGQIYSGAQAKELGLVDHLGNFYDAVDYLADKVGIEGEPTLVSYSEQSSVLRRLFGGLAQSFKVMLGKENQGYPTETILIKESLESYGVENLEISY